MRYHWPKLHPLWMPWCPIAPSWGAHSPSWLTGELWLAAHLTRHPVPPGQAGLDFPASLAVK